MSVDIKSGKTAAVARAIKQRLELIFPKTRFAHEILPARLSERIWTDLLRGTPFVGLGWAANSANSASGRDFNGDIQFDVFLVVKNEGSLEARYFGDRLGPGLFDMADAAVAGLNGMTVQGLGTVLATRVANAFADGLGDDKAIAAVSVVMKSPIAVGDVFDGPVIWGDPLEEVVWTWEIDGDTIEDEIEIPAQGVSGGAAGCA